MISLETHVGQTLTDDLRGNETRLESQISQADLNLSCDPTLSTLLTPGLFTAKSSQLIKHYSNSQLFGLDTY